MSEETVTPSSETPTTETQADPTTEQTQPETTTLPTTEGEPLAAEALQFPEGFQVDEGLRDEFLGIVNDAEMSAADRANALIGLQGKVLEAASEANSAAWNQMQETWQKEVKADPEIGGGNFQATLDKVGNLVAEYGSDELKQAMDITGAGNHPAVIRFLAKVADQLTEVSKPVVGTPASSLSAAQRLYPTMKG